MKKTTQVNWRNVVKIVTWAAISTLAIGLLLFERVNFITTYESLSALFGVGKTWVLILAWAVVLVDLAALAKVLTPEVGRKEPMIVQVLLVVWLVTSMLDMSFSWYFAALEMESTAVQAPAVIRDFIWIMPAVVALAIWCVQGGLLFLFGTMLDRAIHGAKAKAPMPGVSKPSEQRLASSHKYSPIRRPTPTPTQTKNDNTKQRPVMPAAPPPGTVFVE